MWGLRRCTVTNRGDRRLQHHDSFSVLSSTHSTGTKEKLSMLLSRDVESEEKDEGISIVSSFLAWFHHDKGVIALLEGHDAISKERMCRYDDFMSESLNWNSKEAINCLVLPLYGVRYSDSN